MKWSAQRQPRFTALTIEGDLSEPTNREQAAAWLADAAALDERDGAAGRRWLWWVGDPSSDVESLARRAGWAMRRRLYKLHRPLPNDQPPPDVTPIAVRPFDRNRDSEAVLDINNGAFDWHPDQAQWATADLDRALSAAWVRLDDLLVIDTDPVSGFCWMKIHQPGDVLVGEIYLIAVDASRSGASLGSGLLAASLTHMVQRGCVVAELWCEATNIAALGLYEKFGFTVAQVDVAYGPTHDTEAEPLPAPGRPWRQEA